MQNKKSVKTTILQVGFCLIVLAFCLVPAIALLYAYGGARLILQNHTQYDLKDIGVILGKDEKTVYVVKEIPKGQEKKIHVQFKGESGVELKFELNGKEYHQIYDVYIESSSFYEETIPITLDRKQKNK